MPTLRRSAIDAYTDQLDGVVSEHQGMLDEALDRIDWDAPVAVVRDQLIAAMQQVCGGAADMAAFVASVFYDGVREVSIGEPLGAESQPMREPERTDGAVRAFVQDLVDGRGPDPVRAKCRDRVGYEAKRAAAECIEYNARRDPARPRYARVPSGSETCDFCTMLASRGPVYRTERSAGAIDHWHANCDCRVVPVFRSVAVHTGNGGVVRRGGTRIEGYDPDALYDRYIDAIGSPKFRMAVARTGGGSGKETSHPMRWAQAKQDGTVTLGSLGEVKEHIEAATSYEDLFERIELVSREWPYYGMSESKRFEVQAVMRKVRQRLMGAKSRNA